MPAVLGQGLQNFPLGQQPQRPFLRPGQLGMDQRQAAHSPSGSSRTPGRGRFRTPFTQALSAPAALPQDSGFEQPLAGDAQTVRLPGIESGPAESSTSASHSALSLAATVSDLERLSLADDMTATRLRPVAIHTAPSPSDVIRASAARGSSPEASPAMFPLLSGQIYCQVPPQGMPSSSPQPVQVPGVPGPTFDDARAAVIPGSSLTSSAPATSEE